MDDFGFNRFFVGALFAFIIFLLILSINTLVIVNQDHKMIQQEIIAGCHKGYGYDKKRN